MSLKEPEMAFEKKILTFADELRQKHPTLIDLSLNRIEEAMERLGNPHLSLPTSIHVAGTNGKGSVIAFCKSMAEQAEISVHATISPHLRHITERFYISGTYLTERELQSCFLQLKKTINDLPLSYFELLICLFYVAAHQNPADLCLIETGLGGRFDATNVIAQPKVTTLTSISYDHQKWLGHTLKDIAFEKAGIMKQGAVCVVAPQSCQNVHDVFDVRAQELGVQLIKVEDYIDYEQKKLHYRKNIYDLSVLGLHGSHQLDNAATAIVSIIESDVKINKDQILQGLKSVQWQGRLQKISDKPEIWLDGAHNAAGAKGVQSFLSTLPTKNTEILCAFKKQKNFKDILEVFCGYGYTFKITKINEQDNTSISPVDIASFLKLQNEKCEIIENIFSYIRNVQLNKRVLICGSLYLTGYILEHVDNIKKTLVIEK